MPEGVIYISVKFRIMKQRGIEMSRITLNMCLVFLWWTNTFYILICFMSLSYSCERSSFDSQQILSQRHSKYMTTFSEATAAALQASSSEASSCPKGYVVDRFNNNKCVKRFVSRINNMIRMMYLRFYFGILFLYF